MQKLVASIVCFAAVAVCATAGGDKGGKGAKGAKIEGSWIATSAVSDGKKVPEEAIEKIMLTVMFKDGKYSVSAGGMEVEAGTYKTDAAKKPAAIDMEITSGKDKGKMQLGIYKVEKDILTIALSPHGAKERPKNFETPEKGEVTVLKRK